MLTSVKKDELLDFVSGWNLSQRCDFVFSGNKTINIDGSLRPEVVVKTNTLEVKDGDSVFCKTDYLPMLRRNLNRDGTRIKLVTHDSDFEIDRHIFNAINDYVELESWQAANVNYEHEKLSALPLGLANDYCPITLKKDDILSCHEVREVSGPKKLLYVNFNPSTNPQEREPVFMKFKNDKKVTVRHPREISSKKDYVSELLNHKFVVCPRGNGIDTHRVWESLYLGVIPIVKNCIHNRFFQDLPILMVNDFSQIELESLEEIYDYYISSNWDLRKLTSEYWI